MQLFFINYAIRAQGTNINSQPIFILGNQKSGTSAIAGLLAQLTHASVAIDLSKEVKSPTYPGIMSGSLSFSKFVKNHRLEFSKDIIKEPNLTLFYSDLARQFPKAKFAFVVRDPRDNVRSILNRLRIPGNYQDVRLSDYSEMTESWHLIINNRWFGLAGETYIEKMAHRWNFMADVFLKHQEQMVLIRYEDFLRDKLHVLKTTAHRLGLTAAHDIRSQLNTQFQPRGDRNISWHEFFGDENLRRIEAICQTRMEQLNYSISDR
jgi:hypothetical protein